ncbi:AI-2E family transporter [Candidatus Uhrbacteria bacterium]|nr:AI-2E family transporter [Candidatus Uhrbacteria bacterium]
MEPNREVRISIDTWSILKVILVVLALVFLYFIRDILLLVFGALFLAALMHPAVEYLSQKKIPKGVTVITLYVLLLAVSAACLSLFIPLLVEQGSHILATISQSWEALSGGVHWLQDLSSRYGLDDNLQTGLKSLQSELTGLAGGLVGTVTDFVSGTVGLVVVLVMAYYMVVQQKDASKALHNFVPEEYQDVVSSILNRVEEKIGKWLLGQISLCLIIGLMYYVGLLLIGSKGALVFAVWGGFTEFIPYLGPFLGAIPPVLLAFTESPIKAVLALIVIVVIQQTEGHIIVPKVMQKAVGLNPLVSIVALLMGAKLFGLIGALLAIPVATAVSAILSELYRWRQSAEKKP